MVAGMMRWVLMNWLMTWRRGSGTLATPTLGLAADLEYAAVAATWAVFASSAATWSWDMGLKLLAASMAWSRSFMDWQPVMTTEVGRFIAKWRQSMAETPVLLLRTAPLARGFMPRTPMFSL